jgi:hypothetical protein
MGVRLHLYSTINTYLTFHCSFRHYIGIFREEALLDRLSSLLSSVRTHNFETVSLEPHQKDGGVFVRFKYETAGDSLPALGVIQKSVREAAAKHGGIPSWIEWSRGNVWLVRGSPWREVCLIYNTTLSVSDFVHRT